MDDIKQKMWWNYIESDLQELILQSIDLCRISSNMPRYRDYSFVVFPISKAYEGFLKKVFLDMGLIMHEDYWGTNFRIGKALNPSIDENLRNNSWVYGKLERFCGGRELPDNLWNTWKECRNLLFHWFPDEKKNITRIEAKEKVYRVVDSMDMLFKECKIKV